jgi:hypothetical protein
MKSAFVTLAILLLASTSFAVDFGASVNMSGDLWGTNGFKLGSPGQSDGDLLTFSVSTDVAGANAQIRTGDAADDTAAKVRNLAVWFKPVSMVKVTIGNIGSGLFTEQLNWWHVPTGAAGGNSWSSDSGVSGKGINLDITPIEALTISGGVAPGFNNALLIDYDLLTAAKELAVGPNTKAGVTAKYKIEGVGTVGAGYRYNGANSIGVSDWQSIRLGMDLTMVPGLYAFLTGIMRIDNGATSLSSFTIDNYAAYSAGAFTVKAELPVTLRTTAVATDHSYMSYDIKASYKILDNFSPYFRITQDGGLTGDYNRSLDFSDIVFAPKLKLGADYSFGKCSLGTAVQIDVPANDAGDNNPVTWSIPFSARVSW